MHKTDQRMTMLKKRYCGISRSFAANELQLKKRYPVGENW